MNLSETKKTTASGIRAVIFDMDGVIADTEPLKFEAYRRVFRGRFGVEVEEDKVRLGLAERPVVELYLAKHGLAGDVKLLIAEKRQAYCDILGKIELAATPGFFDLMALLKERGIAIALATSSDKKSTDIILRRLSLENAFAAVITQEQVEKKKPDPEIYLQAAGRLGFAPESCVVAEDSPAGVLAGKRAGMKVMGITTGVSEDDLVAAAADLVIPDFGADSRQKLAALLGI